MQVGGSACGALGVAIWKELVSALVSVRRMLFALRKKVLISPHAKRMAQLSPATGDP